MRLTRQRLVCVALAAGLAMVASCSTVKKEEAKAVVSGATVPPKMSEVTPREYEGLENVVAFHEDFFSGSVPEGEAGFTTLAAMGVKTIITVDGAAPDVELAKKHGMRYVHLPIGYNGFDEQRKLELVRATRDGIAQGPVYMHCHHGKHRSAAAAAAVAQSMGWMTVQEGQTRMKMAGTAANYTGLYACAAESTVLGANVIDAVSGDFPEMQPPKGLVKSMVEIDEVNDRLKAIEKAEWKVPADQADLVPTADAGRLADLFRHLQSNERVMRKPADFREKLKADEARAQRLEVMLAAGEQDSKKLSKEFSLLGQSCKECHAKYRD